MPVPGVGGTPSCGIPRSSFMSLDLGYRPSRARRSWRARAYRGCGAAVQLAGSAQAPGLPVVAVKPRSTVGTVPDGTARRGHQRRHIRAQSQSRSSFGSLPGRTDQRSPRRASSGPSAWLARQQKTTSPVDGMALSVRVRRVVLVPALAPLARAHRHATERRRIGESGRSDAMCSRRSLVVVSTLLASRWSSEAVCISRRSCQVSGCREACITAITTIFRASMR